MKRREISNVDIAALKQSVVELREMVMTLGSAVNEVLQLRFLMRRRLGRAAAPVRRKKTVLTIDDIVVEVAREWNIPESQLTDKTREWNTVQPRHVVCYLARRLTTLSLSTIGRRVGVHYSSVAHGTKRIAVRLANDPVFATRVRRAENRLKELIYSEEERIDAARQSADAVSHPARVC